MLLDVLCNVFDLLLGQSKTFGFLLELLYTSNSHQVAERENGKCVIDFPPTVTSRICYSPIETRSDMRSLQKL